MARSSLRCAYNVMKQKHEYSSSNIIQLFLNEDDKLIYLSTSGGADETGCSGDRGSPDGGRGPRLLSRRTTRRTIRRAIRRATRRTTILLLDRSPRRSHRTRHRRQGSQQSYTLLRILPDTHPAGDQVRVHE